MGTVVFVGLAFCALLAPGVVRPLQAEANGEKNPPLEARADGLKVTLGVVEDVVLAPWGISFPARIDTGADLSSLDARDIVVRQDTAEFRLGAGYGYRRLQLPVVEWGRVQTSMGIEKRPVVAISICIGSKLLRTHVTLKDRSGMAYPFLVGRSALKGTFLVDPSRSRATQPNCPSGAVVADLTPH